MQRASGRAPDAHPTIQRSESAAGYGSNGVRDLGAAEVLVTSGGTVGGNPQDLHVRAAHDDIEAPADREPISLPIQSGPGAYVLLLTIPTVVLIVGWNWLYDFTRAAAGSLF